MSFLKFETTGNVFVPRDYKLVVTINGSVSSYYIDKTDLETTIVRLLNNGFVINSQSDFSLNEEESKRLEEVNKLVTNSNRNTYLANIEELDIFITYGYVDPSSKLTKLKELSKQYVSVYRTMLVNEVLAKLGPIRKEVEYAGIKTNYGLVETDPVSQGKISALFQANQIPGLLKTTTPFKMADGEFSELDSDDINILYRKVADLVQNCFHAENETVNLIRVADDQELIKLWKNPSLIREKFMNVYEKVRSKNA